MSFSYVFIVTIIATLIGVFVGLLLRIIRLKIQRKNIVETFILSLKFLIFYPIFFPVMVLRRKEIFVETISKSIYKDLKNKNKDFKISIEKLKSNIMKELTVYQVIIIWLELLKNINQNFDGYIVENISNANEFITIKRKFKKQKKEFNFKIFDSKYLKSITSEIDDYIKKQEEILV